MRASTHIRHIAETTTGPAVTVSAVAMLRPSKVSRTESSPATPGTLRSALATSAFRRVFAGSFVSNIGTWMQNITLIALAYKLTRDAWFTGLITFAQLGPMLFLSPIGGSIADRVNRRHLLLGVAACQSALSLTLAVVALSPQPNRVLLVSIVFCIGIVNAINGPTMNALLPTLVDRVDLQPAIALNSVSMNASRVVGPLLGGLFGALGGPSLVFGLNALTYVFVVWAILGVHADFTPKGRTGEGAVEQLKVGFRAVRADPLMGRVLITISVLSLFCLVFIYQMPSLAEGRLGLNEWQFNLLFASFALGAALGGLAMGSFLSAHDRARTIKYSLLLFAVMLAIFGTTTIVPVAFASVFVLGAAYFVIVTALSTTLQMRVDDAVRGRVMGLWMMAWAGLVPVGSLLAGPVIDSVGIAPVLLAGAAIAAILAVSVDLRDPELHAIGAE